MSERPLRVTICGAAGRMGRTLVEMALADSGISLGGAIEAPGNALLGADAGALAGCGASGVTLECEIEPALAASDVVIDFTRPLPTLEHAAACAVAGIPIVIGTTGFDAAQRRALDATAARIPMVLAPNMSVGVNLCFKLVETATRVLGEAVDIEIIEAHHRHKVDAPSGTAVRLGEIAAAARGQPLADCAVYAREGHTGPRPAGAIGFATVRAGDIVGEHTVMYAGEGERVEITHRAASRANFANGAFRAARWVLGRAPGRYDMQDVLGLG